MKKIILYSLFFFINFYAFAQNNHSQIKVEDKTVGKRVEIYAVNTSDSDYEVFLKLNAVGFRRIAETAVTKVIPANSSVKMFNLVKISNVESNYTYGIIVNEIGHDEEKISNDINFTFDTSKTSKPVIVFVKNYCDLCDNTVKLFRDNNITHTIYNIDEDKEYYQSIQQELLNRKSDVTSLVPIIKVEDSIYNRLENRNKLIEALNNHF